MEVAKKPIRKRRTSNYAIQHVNEHAEQVKIVTYCTRKGYQYFAIPNGGKRSISESRRFKREGVKAGVPDLFLPEPRGQYHGLFLEVKRVINSRTSDFQKYWIDILNRQGYKAVVVKGFDEAKIVIDEYMTIV